MKLTRFARFMYAEGNWTPFIYLLLVAIFLVAGLGLLLADYYTSERIIGIVYVILYFSSFITVGIPALVSKLIYNWACKRFVACFRLSVYTDEKNVLEKLRELAVWLEEEFEKADETLDKEAAEWKIQRAKNRFWSMWRLTKAMGFPVFKSWKTHAKVKF